MVKAIKALFKQGLELKNQEITDKGGDRHSYLKQNWQVLIELIKKIFNKLILRGNNNEHRTGSHRVWQYPSHE